MLGIFKENGRPRFDNLLGALAFFDERKFFSREAP
jgi:hypothetical protein